MNWFLLLLAAAATVVVVANVARGEAEEPPEASGEGIFDITIEQRSDDHA
jgi:hypothetical protein